MVDKSLLNKLFNAFPRSFMNQNFEFIAHKKANEYFLLEDCETELDLKCKVLEWFSRGCCKTEIYQSKAKNDEYHNFMLNGVNAFLGTSFSEDDMEIIYTYLGNACNHSKTIEFIESGYDLSVINKKPIKDIAFICSME